MLPRSFVARAVVVAGFMTALSVPIQAPAVIRMNVHGSGIFDNDRLLLLTRTTEPNVEVAITPDPQAGPITTPGIVVLTCVKTVPVFGEVTGNPPAIYVPGTRLYASGSTQGNPTRHVLIQVLDGGAFGSTVLRDYAAVEFTSVSPAGSFCGADGLALQPLQAGNFVAKPLW